MKAISKELSYSPKYISTIFIKKFNVGIAEYLNTIRLQNACTVMDREITSVSDISNQCGFSDPQYFSKVFKQKMGMSPTTYTKNISRN
ncbi:MAG: helix-turn-helix transcriptional regulator [Clostridia bacterium]|nr:helix-turn-helix transcriptional regulator [Clostridia bacterium]